MELPYTDPDLQVLLDMPEPAPSDGRRTQSQAQKQRVMAPHILTDILDGDGPVDLHAIAAAADLSDSVTNAVGTITGQGVNGRNGMKLNKDSKGRILCDAVNARLTLKHIPQQDLKQCNWTAEQLADAIAALP